MTISTGRTPRRDDAAGSGIRAVFFDIDGTLTSFATHTVPQSTVDALHALHAKGVRVYICTGRSPEQMKVVLDAIPFRFDGIAGVNGQYCWRADGTVVSDQPIDVADVRAVVGWLDRHPDVVAVFAERDTAYFNHDSERMRAMWRSLGKTAPKLSFTDPHTRIQDNRIYQISPYVGADDEQAIVACCHAVRGVRWHPDFVDLIPASGGKDRGVEALLADAGLARAQSMAFGDGGNDVDMLRYAHIGVAMGNGTDDAKAAADYVTRDVDDDGVLHALRRFGIL
ncbi:Cof-type HAD-IIB family hydrolase [Bifidobacterium castoris]|uniref:Hydrolase n=1 Tax=Bifidobacterium castoris TaxID=2306972 RepID=A0A430F9N6_9BIFI|nr:Cof-type HAD-IIB family hydrolase [Bifidobacterium castoris]RSX49545.1 hydrolase [Bifidobacterium castoris]